MYDQNIGVDFIITAEIDQYEKKKYVNTNQDNRNSSSLSLQ